MCIILGQVKADIMINKSFVQYLWRQVWLMHVRNIELSICSNFQQWLIDISVHLLNVQLIDLNEMEFSSRFRTERGNLNTLPIKYSYFKYHSTGPALWYSPESSIFHIVFQLEIEYQLQMFFFIDIEFRQKSYDQNL